MEIVLLTVGKTTTRYINTGITEYLQRLKHYISFNIIDLPDIKVKGKISEDAQKSAEGDKILGALKAGDRVILLDERGTQPDSDGFALMLQKQMSSGIKRLVFVVGGPYGFSHAVYNRADAKFSMSKLTLNHEMVRLFFIEQVYRAMTILRGEPYHHR